MAGRQTEEANISHLSQRPQWCERNCKVERRWGVAKWREGGVGDSPLVHELELIGNKR